MRVDHRDVGFPDSWTTGYSSKSLCPRTRRPSEGKSRGERPFSRCIPILHVERVFSNQVQSTVLLEGDSSITWKWDE